MPQNSSKPRQNHDIRNPDQLAAKVERLQRLLNQHDSKCWQVGDLVAAILDKHRVRLGWLSEKVGYQKARLSELALTARAFRPDQRDGYTFQDCLLARRIHRTMPALGMSLLAIRKRIARLKGKRPTQVKAHFIQQLIAKQQNEALAESAKYRKPTRGMVNRCHHADYRKIIPRLPDASIKFLNADPPFGGYRKVEGNGGYISTRAETNGLRSDTDANTAEEAMAVTLSIFEICLPKLSNGGCLALFQPGGKPDRPAVLAEAERCGSRHGGSG